MAITRLTDPQKEELVARFSQGEASLALAESYGVSANTVSRVVRAALPPEVYESLKQQRARGGVTPVAPMPSAGNDSSSSEVDAAPDPGAAAPTAVVRSRRRRSAAGPEAVDTAVAVSGSGTIAPEAAEPAPAAAPEPGLGAEALIEPALPKTSSRSRRRRATADPGPGMASPGAAEADGAGANASAPGDLRAGSRAHRSDVEHQQPDSEQQVLAIDDADDFAADAVDDDFADEGDADLLADDGQLFVPVAVNLTPLDQREAVTCRPLASAGIHGGVYMLVDKTVELQPKPLRDFSELGALPDDEAERQAITVFINPREAKRQCGRSQRVIKMPDATLLERTAPYLLAQGISRVVVEGALYALPGS